MRGPSAGSPPRWRIRLTRRPGGKKRGIAIAVHGILPHPPEIVFEALTDPDWIRAHPGVSELEIVQSGEEAPEGPGAIRWVTLPSGRFRERVVGWDPPHRIDIAIDRASVPIDHHGVTIRLEPVPGGTAVAWTAGFSVNLGIASLPVAWWAGREMADYLAWHLGAVDAQIRGMPTGRRQRGHRLAWVLLPVAAWNLALAPLLPPSMGSHTGIPTWFLALEHALRFALIGLAFVLRARSGAPRTEWATVWVGVVAYFGSWLPLLADPTTANRPLLALAPAITPALFLFPMAGLSRSWVFAAVATTFLVAHVTHQSW